MGTHDYVGRSRRRHSFHRESQQKDIGAAKDEKNTKDHLRDYHGGEDPTDDGPDSWDSRMEHFSCKGSKMRDSALLTAGKSDRSAYLRWSL